MNQHSMAAGTLFSCLLDDQFSTLDPCVRWVHSGQPRTLKGAVTVERGTGAVARVLGTFASLPAAMQESPIEVSIDVIPTGEKWVRLFAGQHFMVSTLSRDRKLLVERLGPAVLKFRLAVRDGAMEWQLEHIAAFGIPLPRKCFRIAAMINARGARYQFAVDCQLIGVGRIVRYEGFLDADE